MDERDSGLKSIMKDLKDGTISASSAVAQSTDLAKIELMKTRAARENLLQFLVFQVGKGHYGINILETHEILKPVQVTRIPNSGNDILGVLNLRGNIIPVVDVNKKFLGRHSEISNFSRIVVAAHEGKFTGLLVDRVVEVARVKEDSVEGAEVRGLSQEYINGAARSGERIFLILNLEIIFKKNINN